MSWEIYGAYRDVSTFDPLLLKLVMVLGGEQARGNQLFNVKCIMNSGLSGAMPL